MDIHDAVDTLLAGNENAQIVILDGAEAVIVTEKGSRVRVWTGEIISAALSVESHRKSVAVALKELFDNGRIG